MFCLDRPCLYRQSINNSESGGWSRWWRKELSRSLTLFLLREGRDNRSKGHLRHSSSESKIILYVGILLNCARMALIRRTSLDMEDMKRQRHKSIQRLSLLFSFYPHPLTDTLSSKMSKIIHTSSYYCHEKIEEKPNMHSAKLISLLNLPTDHFSEVHCCD